MTWTLCESPKTQANNVRDDDELKQVSVEKDTWIPEDGIPITGTLAEQTTVNAVEFLMRHSSAL